MKYLSQCLWILVFSFLGELAHMLLSLPIPASIYGLILLFLALNMRIVKLEQVQETANFLVSLMGLMFVCPTVGLLKYWDVVRENWGSVCVIILVSTLLTFFVSGRVTQLFIKKEEVQENG